MELPALVMSALDSPAFYLPRLGVALVLWAIILGAGRVVYNLFFHPLRNFPGPLICRSTNLWRTGKLFSGDLPQHVRRLHEQYGPVVRIAPHELAFIDSQAWKDIYGHHNTYEMAKDDRFYRPMGKNVADTIISADRENHGFLRRQMSHGFSDRSMRAQEPIFREYVDLLIQRLAERAGTDEPLDMKAWFNFTTFDVIGNLAFGSDFGCLENASYHPWVEAITGNLKDTAMMRGIIQFISPTLVFKLFRLGIFKGRKAHVNYTKDKVRGRMAMTAERPDFMEGLLKKRDTLSLEEIEVNSALLVLAGSETTATLLCGALYLLGSHPDTLNKLIQEVRTTFTNEEQIDLVSVNGLNYMLACLNEALRLYPPVPVGLPRVVPKGGNNIAGHWVPQDSVVSVWQLAAYYSSRNFARPEEFCPERFLGDPEFAKDDLGVVQPFSIGPRNCVGRNLAYAEMRLILARLLYRFDVKPAPGAKNWIDRQKVYTIWEKPELPFYLTAAVKTV
ncbi:putative cytochrome P450 [Rosellinia necatrix]|uniref:Putative cytochrome P450 n=1 Tax=Rosellinia necatrix TaxID=77044 RepID=A0A1W2TCK3_ROSNE|nr:putative cytochrome P450 [Rosellinia necatrix]